MNGQQVPMCIQLRALLTIWIYQKRYFPNMKNTLNHAMKLRYGVHYNILYNIKLLIYIF